jgi:hypothetical protein
MGLARVFLAAAILLVASPAAPQQATSCKVCHTSSGASLPTFHRTDDWNRSPHAAVGCQTCHGGDALNGQPVDAHRGVRDAASPFSTMHPANVTRTCGLCHPATAAAFGGTIHQILIDAGDRRAPTCATCHGLAFTHVPSAAEAERICATCHRPGTVRGSYPAAMRAAIDALNARRARVEAVPPGAARDQARLAIAASVAALHRMDPRTIADQRVAIRH